jgi:hypothetical protein
MKVSIVVLAVISVQKRTSLLDGIDPEAANMMSSALMRLISFGTHLYCTF